MLSAGLGGTEPIGYMHGMVKPEAPSTTTIRDTKTGRNVTVLGVGALKGHLTLRKGVDLTKPIASQAMKGGKRRPTAASA